MKQFILLQNVFSTAEKSAPTATVLPVGTANLTARV
jgi:hypothetical protein